MKTFYYPLGHVEGITMTVRELKAKLANYPDDMPVRPVYEGQYTFIAESDFTRQMIDGCECLIINVECYW